MLVMRTIENPANPIGEFVSAQQPVGFDYFALAMNPLGLYGVQPRTLLGKKATHDPHTFTALLDFSVVLSEPAPHLFGDMPTRVVPDQKQNLLADPFKLLGTPSEKLPGYRAYGPTIHESQPRLIEVWQVEPVTRDGFRIGIVLGDRLLDEAQRLALLGEATQGGQGQPAPPALVQETHRPGLGVVLGHLHQSIAPSFFFRRADRVK